MEADNKRESKAELIKRVASCLQQYRMENRLTQAALAERLGISDSHYNNIETGKKMMSLQLLCYSAELLGLSLDSILLGRELFSRSTEIAALLSGMPKGAEDYLMRCLRYSAEHFPRHLISLSED